MFAKNAVHVNGHRGKCRQYRPWPKHSARPLWANQHRGYSSRPFPWTLKTQLTTLFREALREIAPEAADAEIHFERPCDAAHGDLATNVAMQLARKLKRNPRQIAEALLERLRPCASNSVESSEVAGTGFINICLKRSSKTRILGEVPELGASLGRAKTPASEKVMVEFLRPWSDALPGAAPSGVRWHLDVDPIEFD